MICRNEYFIRAYLCTNWNTHSRSLGLPGVHGAAFSIVLVGNQIESVRLAVVGPEIGPAQGSASPVEPGVSPLPSEALPQTIKVGGSASVIVLAG